MSPMFTSDSDILRAVISLVGYTSVELLFRSVKNMSWQIDTLPLLPANRQYPLSLFIAIVMTVLGNVNAVVTTAACL